MDRDDVRRWVGRYEEVWRTPGTSALGELFTEDATYLASPWATPVVGVEALAAFWESEREGAEEEFTLAAEVVAVDGDTAVVRVQVDYERAGAGRWRDLWVIRFADDGRCCGFEEWPFAPDQPDGH